jgi:dUTP pyrophosphatase
MSLRIKKLTYDAIIPTRGSGGAVGYDLYSTDEVVIPPTHRALIGTGVAIVLPPGVYGRVAPRSGLAVKHGIQVGAGVVDPDYTGEVKVVLFNHGDKDFEVKRGSASHNLFLRGVRHPMWRKLVSLKRRRGVQVDLVLLAPK